MYRNLADREAKKEGQVDGACWSRWGIRGLALIPEFSSAC